MCRSSFASHRLILSTLATHTAYMDAIERVISAPSLSLTQLDAEAVKAWVTHFTQAQ